jgi:hypothetical protein
MLRGRGLGIELAGGWRGIPPLTHLLKKPG